MCTSTNCWIPRQALQNGGYCYSVLIRSKRIFFVNFPLIAYIVKTLTFVLLFQLHFFFFFSSCPSFYRLFFFSCLSFAIFLPSFFFIFRCIFPIRTCLSSFYTGCLSVNLPFKFWFSSKEFISSSVLFHSFMTVFFVLICIFALFVIWIFLSVFFSLLFFFSSLFHWFPSHSSYVFHYLFSFSFSFVSNLS